MEARFELYGFENPQTVFNQGFPREHRRELETNFRPTKCSRTKTAI